MIEDISTCVGMLALHLPRVFSMPMLPANTAAQGKQRRGSCWRDFVQGSLRSLPAV